MSEKISTLSEKELDAVGAGTFFPPLIDASTNIYGSYVKNTNVTSVKWSWNVGVQQGNNVGTSISVTL
jgi:hypothetical protein